MILKRKRSGSELSTSASSTPPRGGGNNQITMSMDMSPPSSLLNSRTMKRFRNGRPSDDEVHQRTLNLLYSAQHGGGAALQHQSGAAAALQQFPQCQPQQQPSVQQQQQQQQQQQENQGLHRFWNINSAPPVQGSAMTQAPTFERPAACEDCGAGLDDGMDVDGGAGDDTACGACGKHICYSCSVSNLGEQKRCLHCAGRRVWVGGIGWTNAEVSVC
ncbi:hypothetical protein N3K66_005763 [Trichothecium roseum]|uniref:Uncharacterized protein n=1 Tax=Trichothecium roseum TaxID=47278 RepID=A0ACC0UYS1_9HYPO|nr:hypothetical protein N3K66_005763 [Trichothecium roseum]